MGPRSSVAVLEYLIYCLPQARRLGMAAVRIPVGRDIVVLVAW